MDPNAVIKTHTLSLNWHLNVLKHSEL